jgi:SAM-dependent methyltransferase
LTLFSEILDFKSLGTVLDAGCGNGRNSIYLAKKGCLVHSIDYSEAALKLTRDATAKENLEDKITVHKGNILSFPFESSSFDFVIDSYVFCHFLEEEKKQSYRAELKRVTKPGGFVFSSVFSFEDEFYKGIFESNGGKGNIVTDPNNGVTKYLYTEASIKAFFSSEFDISYFVKFEFNDVVLDSPYKRSVLALVLRKPYE